MEEMNPLEKQLAELIADQKAFQAKAMKEIRNAGSQNAETKETHDKIWTEVKQIHRQLDAVDARTQQIVPSPASGRKSITDQFLESADFKEAADNGFGRKGVRFSAQRPVFEAKTNITETNLGSATSGVMLQQRMPGIYGIAQQALRIRDVMRVVPQATGNSFDYVYQATRTNAVSPQVEGIAKSQSYFNWTTASGSIRTLAHYIKVSRQALDDVSWLRNQIDAELLYGLKVKEEAEILSGDGTGVHLNGIVTQATAFDAGYLAASAGWTYLDILRYAKLQARVAGLATYPPDAFVLNPVDLAYIETIKDSDGGYVVGDPKAGTPMTLVWGLPVVESDSITADTFLVGAFGTAAALIDRAQASIEIAFQNDTDFIANLATILCEERIGLAVMKAAAFITGSFSRSPA